MATIGYEDSRSNSTSSGCDDILRKSQNIWMAPMYDAKSRSNNLSSSRDDTLREYEHISMARLQCAKYMIEDISSRTA